jgi:hypothetical protein
MSGRLVILPKKSYCPWNPKNVARVERDEAQHRLTLQQEEQRQEAIRAEQRQAALRRTAADQQHVNLFANEERKEQMLQKQLQAHQQITNNSIYDESEDRESSRTDNLPVLGKVSLVGESTTKSYKQLHSDRDRQKKNTLDPMAHYVDPDADVEGDQFNLASKEATDAVETADTQRDRKRKSSRSHDGRDSSQHPRAGTSRRFANDTGSAKDTRSRKHRKKAKRERSSSIQGRAMESGKARK